jgi:hypothetical protein
MRAQRRFEGAAARLLLVAVVITVAGCGSGPSVKLLTGRGSLGPLASGMVSCYTDFASGVLTVDATYGTAITDQGQTTPVMWPLGYIGRQAGSQVDVLDGAGTLRARTGNHYQIEGGYGSRDPRAFVACGYVLPK